MVEFEWSRGQLVVEHVQYSLEVELLLQDFNFH